MNNIASMGIIQYINVSKLHTAHPELQNVACQIYQIKHKE